MPNSRCLFRTAALFLFAGLLFSQRADRATITGIVTDPTGNSIPSATVRIRNDNTGVETPLTTNESGLYTSPLLTLGTYTVTVERSGFKSVVRSNIEVLGGQTYRVDARLELGSVSERVEVSAAGELVNTEQPDVANTVGDKYYRDLPVVMGGDIRLAEALLQLQPGYTPMRPNGDPMFRGQPVRIADQWRAVLRDGEFLRRRGFRLCLRASGQPRERAPDRKRRRNARDRIAILGAVRTYQRRHRGVHLQEPAPATITATCTNILRTTR